MMGRRNIEVCDFCNQEGDECFTEDVRCCRKDACELCRIKFTKIDENDNNHYYFYCRKHWQEKSLIIMDILDGFEW